MLLLLLCIMWGFMIPALLIVIIGFNSNDDIVGMYPTMGCIGYLCSSILISFVYWTDNLNFL